MLASAFAVFNFGSVVSAGTTSTAACGPVEELFDDASSPPKPAKKPKSASTEARTQSKDHTASQLLHHLQEADKRARESEEAERKYMERMVCTAIEMS